MEETAELVQHPAEVVQEWYTKYKAAALSELSVCGTDCSTCYCYGEMCKGCNACSGKVFHAAEGKSCAIYACVVDGKKLRNCGECEAALCDIWMQTRDPKFSDEEFDKNVKERIGRLKKA